MAHVDTDGLTLAAYYAANQPTGHLSPVGLTTPRLVIIAGQSNATGRADVAGCDPGLGMSATYASAVIAQKTSDATTNPIGWDFDYAARDLQPYRVGGNPGMGVELSMGRYLRAYVPAFASSEPYMAKIAINGTALASWWLPGLPDDAVLPGTDNLFDQFCDYINDHLTASTYRLGAIIWIQGEADATVEAQANAYQANLQTFYDALLVTFGNTFEFVFNKLHVDCVEAFTTTVRAAQVAFAAANPTVVLVDCDDIPLPSGDVHFAGDSMVTLGNRLAEAAAAAMYSGRDTDRATSSAPIIQAINEPCARGTDGLTAANNKKAPRIPIHAAGDDLFLVVATGLLDAAPTTPTGWTLEASKQSITGGNYVNVRVYRKRAVVAGTTAPDVADTNNLNVALCFVVRGGAASPIDVVGAASNDAYNVTVTLPSVTTTADSCLVLSILAGYSGDPNISQSGWTNAALAGLVEYRDSSFNVDGTGNGMFIAVAAGTKATAGATGATTVTPSNISINCGITIAVKA